MNKKALLIASTLLLAGMPAAYAIDADQAWLADFRKADLNDSGGLSKVELGKAKAPSLELIRKNFDAIDTDKDGQVTADEYRHFLAKSARPGQQAAAARDHCGTDCGHVTRIDHYKAEGKGSAVGAIAGGLAGGLLGHQVGKGTGNTIATVGGAAGGAYAGYEVEKKLKSKKMVKVTVKFDDGHEQSFDFEEDKSDFASGDRVQARDGRLTRYSGQ